MFEIINEPFAIVNAAELGCYCDTDMCSVCDDGDDGEQQ